MRTKKKMSTRKLAVTGMMVSITMLLAYTPLGIIPLQPISATITHIPTIIIAILEGPVIGGITGCAFGLVSLFKALTQPSGILDPYLINPIISVFPRIMIGVVAGYSYKGLSKLLKKSTISAVLSAALGSLTNTFGVMGLMYFIYAKDLANTAGTAAGPLVWGIISTYGIVEMTAAAVICTGVSMAVKKAFYTSRIAA